MFSGMLRIVWLILAELVRLKQSLRGACFTSSRAFSGSPSHFSGNANAQLRTRPLAPRLAIT